MFETYALKGARMVLGGGKSEKTYLSRLGRGIYYGSYRYPRTLVWAIGTIIFILMVATAFLGYVLPFGQMSLWGK